MQIIEIKSVKDFPETGLLIEAIMKHTRVYPSDANGKKNYNFIYQDGDIGTVDVGGTYFDFWKNDNGWFITEAE